MGKRKAGKLLWLVGALALAYVALSLLDVIITLLIIGVFVGAGVGLWFLIRRLWRGVVTKMPESGVARAGLRLKPLQRKLFAGFASAFVIMYVIGSLVTGTTADTSSAESTDVSTQEESVEVAVQSEPVVSAAVEDEPATVDLGDLTVTFIDVGQGDSELVELPDGKIMLIDAGEASSSQAVLDALEAAGVDQIDYLVASHPHADHIGGMEAVLAAYDVASVWAPDAPGTTETYEGFLDAVEAKGLSINVAVSGTSIVDDEAGYSIELLAPEGDVESDDMNDYSAIVLLTYGDTSFLFTGDATAQEIVDASPGHVDVLKVAHHGSETGTDASVMTEASPDAVVMSYAEGNSYGHPDQVVLDAISSAGATAYSTAANGNVVAVSDGTTVTITTEKTGEITAGLSAEERAQQEAEAEAQAQEEAEAQAEAEAQTQEETQTDTQTQTQTETQTQTQTETQQQSTKTVYITQTGEKYHRQGCRTLSRSKNLTEMTEDRAIALGYEACKVCSP